MIDVKKTVIVITGYKGGVGKTITAIHLAGYFSTRRTNPLQTLLVDGDGNRSAKTWGRDNLLPYRVVTEKEMIRYISQAQMVVFDTAALPQSEDLVELASTADLIILPTKPDSLSLHATLRAYSELPQTSLKKILICENPPAPETDGEVLRQTLLAGKYEVFNTAIRRAKGFGLACDEGKLIKDIKHRSKKAWYDYEDLGKEIERILKS